MEKVADSQQYGYRSVEKSAGPYQIVTLIEGVRACVLDLAKVQPKEDVLILTDYEIDPVVIQAFIAQVKQLDAIPHILHTRPFSLGGKDPDNPSDLVIEAFKAADVVFSLCWFPDIHHKKMNIHICDQANTRWVSLYQMATVECLSSPAARYPLPILYFLTQKMTDICKKTKKVRVTSPEGTDVTFEINPSAIGGGATGPLEKGRMRAAFPLSALGIFPPSNANGYICSHSNYITGESAIPIRLTLENNYVVDIAGGDIGQAEAIKRYLQGPKKVSKFPLIEAQWGLNPKARLKGTTQIEKERHATTIHFGVGMEMHTEGLWDCHNDFGIPTPTMYFDGEILVQDRRLKLLEDPEVRELASKYGDPDSLLSCHIYT